jgi:hypothetical protein
VEAARKAEPLHKKSRLFNSDPLTQVSTYRAQTYRSLTSPSAAPPNCIPSALAYPKVRVSASRQSVQDCQWRVMADYGELFITANSGHSGF